MLKIKNLLKTAIIGLGVFYLSIPSLLAQVTTPATLTQTITTNDNGKITRETTSGTVKTDTPVGAGIDTPLVTTPETIKAEDIKPEDTPVVDEALKKEDEKTEQQFTGMYKDRQMFPDMMAVHCKVNAEDIVKDMSRLEGCIRQYVVEMNNDNIVEAQEGKKEYKMLVHNAALDLLLLSIKKKVTTNSYEETMNKYAKATGDGATQFDMEASLSNTLAFATEVQNDMRELSAETLKFGAIVGLASVDSDALEEEMKKTEKAKKVEAAASSSSSVTTQVKTGVKVGGDEEETIDDAAPEETEGQPEEPDTSETEGAESAETAFVPKSEYEQQLAQMTDEELKNEQTRLRDLEQEYSKYLETQRGGELAWETDVKQEYENISKKLEQIKNEQKRRRSANSANVAK